MQTASIKTPQHGFTLIELMITVAIVAVLAAVAYPSYMSQIRRSHRAEAKTALLQIQVAEEKYFLSNNAYGTAALLDSFSKIQGLTLSSSNFLTAGGYYKITITLSGTGNVKYTATADAQGSQSGDSYCLKYQITETGDKSGTTNADCWTR